jgi:ubiquinone/menaquinone biosynthesis C-methylase UbiE
MLGGPRFYDTFAEVFFLGRRRATFEAFISASGLQPGQRVLDVGCGTGYFVRLLAEAVGPGGTVVGIDPDPTMVAYASGKARHLPNSKFQIDRAESLHFPDEHFDLVVSSLVMHHVPPDLHARVLREMSRVLRPGGTLFIADAQTPSHGLGWRLLLLITGHNRMVRQVPDLERLAAQAEFSEIRSGEAPLPWLRYARAVKPAQSRHAARVS